MSEASAAQIAVYIDFDNIVMSRYDEMHGKLSFRNDKANSRFPTDVVRGKLQAARVDLAALIDYASSFGTVSVARAYADWSGPVNASYAADTMRKSIDLVQLFPLSGSKNGADIRLAIDVIDDLSRYNYITHVLIVAGDSDYVSLGQRCKRLGRTVVGVGAAKSVSRYWKLACDEFRLYEDLVSIVQNEPSDESGDAPPDSSEAILRRALSLSMQSATQDWVPAGHLKNIMKRLEPTFDETKHGFKSFSAFLAAWPHILTVEKTDSGHLVQPIGAGDLVTAEPGTRQSSPPEHVLDLRKALGLGLDLTLDFELEHAVVAAMRAHWSLVTAGEPRTSSAPVSEVATRLIEDGVPFVVARRAAALSRGTIPEVVHDEGRVPHPNPEFSALSDSELLSAFRRYLADRLRNKALAVPTLDDLILATHGDAETPGLREEYEAAIAGPSLADLTRHIGPMLLPAPVLWDFIEAATTIEMATDVDTVDALGTLLRPGFDRLERDIDTVDLNAAFLCLERVGFVAGGERRAEFHDHRDQARLGAAIVGEWLGALTTAGVQLMPATTPFDSFLRLVLPDRYSREWRRWVAALLTPVSC